MEKRSWREESGGRKMCRAAWAARMGGGDRWGEQRKGEDEAHQKTPAEFAILLHKLRQYMRRRSPEKGHSVDLFSNVVVCCS